jgi:hypothetical protein
MAPRCRPLADRFEENVMRDPNSGCWLWMGSLDRKGYGTIGSGGRRGKHLPAHRVSLALTGVDVPSALNVCHKCDVPACVNPGHLFLGTQADNIADMMAKGRAPSREERSIAMRGFKWPADKIRSGTRHWHFGKRLEACKHGHTFTPDNIVLGSDGCRRCRTCRNTKSRIAMRAKCQQKREAKS